MAADSIPSPSPQKVKTARPFRRAVLRGLGIALPPLLTIVVFVWVWSALSGYVLKPLEKAAEEIIVWRLIDRDVLREVPPTTILVEQDRQGDVVSFTHEDRVYRRLFDRTFVPEQIYQQVLRRPGQLQVGMATSRQFYGQYVRTQYLRRSIVIPAFLAVFILLLYLAGKFVSARLGRMIWRTLELLIERLPIVRNVYSSVKQVTDFMFSEREIQFTRVVALEYPRKRIWSIGFVTGESMMDITAAANEPVVSVLIPTSPMPATGYTITIPKSETIDLNLTIDQAIQYIVSCGVVVPISQQVTTTGRTASDDQTTSNRIASRINASVGSNGQHSESNAAKPVLPPGDS